MVSAVMGLVPLIPMLFRGQLCSIMFGYVCMYILCEKCICIYMYVCIKKHRRGDIQVWAGLFMSVMIMGEVNFFSLYVLVFFKISENEHVILPYEK